MSRTPLSPNKSPTRSPNKSPRKRAATAKESKTYVSYSYSDIGFNENTVEIDHLRTTIVALKQNNQVVNDIGSELDTKTTELKSNEDGRAGLQAQLRDYIRKSEEDSRKNKEFQDSLLRKNGDLENDIKRQRNEIDNLKAEKADRESTIDAQNSNILQLKNYILRIEQELEVRKDVERELASSRAHVKDLEAQKNKLKNDLTIASDYLIDQDDKVHQANRTSLELLQHLKDSEFEIESLKDYIVELKLRISVYIPFDNDNVDLRLAEYINNYPERNRLKVMFMRESSGVYQFGSKKVFVKVEKDKIYIRVGGGYLTIDEFLDLYTPLEIEKIERKSPMRKFSEKVAVQKTLLGREVRESSPIRSPVRSPTRTSPSRKSSPRKNGSPQKR
jgi:hypothetical protein